LPPRAGYLYYKGFPVCQANESHEPRSGSIDFLSSPHFDRQLHTTFALVVDPSGQVAECKTTTGH
jgi:hypothetical protein